MVSKMELPYLESVDILDAKYVNRSSDGYTLPAGINEIGDLKLMLNSLHPNEIKITITIDDIRLRSNLTTNKTVKFSKKSFSIQY